jgi:hypothetical protein
MPVSAFRYCSSMFDVTPSSLPASLEAARRRLERALADAEALAPLVLGRRGGQSTLLLDALIADAAKRAPKGHSWLVDQVQRASESTVLNLVEGNGRNGADRQQHLRIARGSAYP